MTTLPSQSLKGKHAVVTGGARGIGAAISAMLVARGASTTILGRAKTPDLRSIFPAEMFDSLNYLAADVTDPDGLLAALAEAQQRWGPPAILINNAGQAASSPFLKTDLALWRSMMDVNLDGVFHCTRAALPGMLDAGWGRIVNVASTAGLVGYAYVSAYCAAKHAVVGFTRALALEVATKGVTVNAVCPGFTETDMLRASIANIVAKTGRTAEQARAELVSRNPQKMSIHPDQVANAVLWLCLPGSEAVTGQALSVSGGEVM